jgi:hypothetical protein
MRVIEDLDCILPISLVVFRCQIHIFQYLQTGKLKSDVQEESEFH